MFCQFRGASVMCGPRGLKGEPDHLFHNNGDGTFTDVSKQAGVADEGHCRYGFTSVFVDVDNDGKVDLLVANDSTPNYIYLNKGDGTFKDVSIPSGFALNQDDRSEALRSRNTFTFFHPSRRTKPPTLGSSVWLLLRNTNKTSLWLACSGGCNDGTFR
jgi:hypothetical protein